MKKQKKGEKRKPKYGLFSCVGYIYKKMWRWEKRLAFSCAASIPFRLMSAALALYLPSAILNVLQVSDTFLMVTEVIAALVVTQTLFDALVGYTNLKNGNSEHILLLRMLYEHKERAYDKDWYLSLDPEIQKIENRSQSAIQHNHTAGVHFPVYFSNLIYNILSFILFGAVTVAVHPMLIGIITVGVVVNYFMMRWKRKRDYATRDIRNSINKKLDYLTYRISRDYKYAKDIRLYNLADYISMLAKKLLGENEQQTKLVEKRGILVSLVSFLVVLVRDGAVYAILIYKAVNGELTPAEFTLYFSAVTQLSGFMSGILNEWSRVQDAALQMSDYREYFDIKDKLCRGEGITPRRGCPVSIEFRNVSYRYPQGEKPVIENLSFKIEAGEKIALVGLNGAGKTTLTHLMCGLLVPDTGEVLIDGHSIYEYNRDELYDFFSLVPQKYSLMPISIAENIAVCQLDNIDYDRLSKCIAATGLNQKTDKLPAREKTLLNKQVNPSATDLSGGEAQKLLMARAMYRGAQILILDEPTAALDPIAEDEMYQKYNELSENTTSIFISHRLASTRFCDRIFFLDGAAFAEVGTHEELMEKRGKYRELFDIQAKYYQEEVMAHG